MPKAKATPTPKAKAPKPLGVTATGARVLALVARPGATPTVLPVVGIVAVRTSPGAVAYSCLVIDGDRVLPVEEVAAGGAAVSVVSPWWPPADDERHLADVLQQLEREATEGRRPVTANTIGRAE